MVIVKLIGGLGNQLFQYAAARRISYLNDIPLKLDVSGFAQYKLHNYSLMYFNVNGEIASQDEVDRFNPQCIFSKIACKLLHKFKLRYKQHVTERYFHFDPDILKIDHTVYLDGYWQSEKYFKDIENILREELSIKTPADHDNTLMIEKIKNTNAVSLHVRRSDYVTNSHTHKIHGTCSLEYYYEAVRIIAAKVENPHFFIFSDDHQWATDYVNLRYPVTFVSHNGPDKNYEDLRLMSLCKHNIIANSTFSWWGAWLNPNRDKIIIAPKQWFANDTDVSDLLPQDWIKV